MDERPQQPPSLESEGVPDLEGPLPEKEATGDAQEGLSPPRDTPGASVDWGTTALEQQRGEPLGMKLAREEPDREPAAQQEAAGRLVAPDQGAGEDREKDEVAEAFPDTDLSAEEEAVRRGTPRQ